MRGDNHSRLLERLEEVALQLMRRMHAKMDVSMAYGITGSQFFVLKRIHEHGRMTVSAAAEEIGVSLSAITALVDRLVKAGLVTRSRDEDDRRLVWLEVTPQGEEVLKACQAGRKQIMEKYLGQLADDDLEQLVRIYEKLLRIMKEEEKE
ncbi:MAG: MarR family transcriptional regulator [Bacillota bacterium]